MAEFMTMTDKTLTAEVQAQLDRWIDMVHSEAPFDGAEMAALESFLLSLDECPDFYNSEWPGFGIVDEFPFSAVSLDVCLDAAFDSSGFLEGEEGSEEDAICCFRNEFETGYRHFSFYLRELRGGGDRTAWLLVKSVSYGQGGCEDEGFDLCASPLAAEKLLRKRGNIFSGPTPSGGIDYSAGDEILKLLQREKEKRLRGV